jgi:hypothetical protein
MISDLVLFCGGNSIYDSNRPKPLALMPNTVSILGNYLRQDPLKRIPRIVALVEERHTKEFQLDCTRQKSTAMNIRLLEVSNGSTTFEKMQQFLLSRDVSGDTFLFSYPDIFFFGDWKQLLEFDYVSHKMLISGVYLQTRFPEINFNSYSQRVHSVSLRPTRIPANTKSIYGGHFGASRKCLEESLLEFQKIQRQELHPSLEGDFFTFLSSVGRLYVSSLEGAWKKADSIKEMMEIIQLIED